MEGVEMTSLIATNKSSPQNAHVGLHVLADFWHGIQITEPAELRALLSEAAKIGNKTILGEVSHAFTPHGLTGVLLLAESHIAIHTWPEFNYMSIDIFACGDTQGTHDALDYLKQQLKPERVEIHNIKRGVSVLDQSQNLEPGLPVGAGITDEKG